MEIISHLIEWIGVLFLSIEAIKLDNLKRLTDILGKIRIALNSPIYPSAKKNEYLMLAAPKNYKLLRKFSVLITYFIGLVFILIMTALMHLFPFLIGALNKYVLIFSGVSFFRIIVDGIATIVLLLFFPFGLGNEIIRVFSVFAVRYHLLMVSLEKNTFNGVIGSIGFFLVTIATVINIATHK